MTDIHPDEDMSRQRRAGDSRRVLNATLYYAAGDQQALRDVMDEAHNVGHGHHFVLAAIEYLTKATRLDQPANIDLVRQEIARLDAIEHGYEN